MADDKITCPECGARGIASTDGRLYCQGPSDVTLAKVNAAESNLKAAVANGDETRNLDIAWRTISAQRICGMIFYREDATSGWRRVVPGPGA